MYPVDPFRWPHPSHIVGTETRNATGGDNIDTGGRAAVRSHREDIDRVTTPKSTSLEHREERRDLNYNNINTVGGQEASDRRRTINSDPKPTCPERRKAQRDLNRSINIEGDQAGIEGEQETNDLRGITNLRPTTATTTTTCSTHQSPQQNLDNNTSSKRRHATNGQRRNINKNSKRP